MLTGIVIAVVTIVTLSLALWVFARYFARRAITVNTLRKGESGFLPPWVFYKSGGKVYVYGDIPLHPERMGTAQVKVVKGDVGIVADVDLEYVRKGKRVKHDCQVFVRV